MIKKILCLCCVITTINLFGQQPRTKKKDYDTLIKQGVQAMKDSLYERAFLCYTFARQCDPSKGQDVDKALALVFKKVEEQRKTAEKRAKVAIEQRNTAEKNLRAAHNLATAIIAKQTNITLAFSILEYNAKKHPEDKVSAYHFKEMQEGATGRSLFFQKILRGHLGRIVTLDFSPDGKYVATGSEDETAKLWSIETGKCLKTFFGHQSRINCVVFSPDGQYIATASIDKTVKLWSVESGACLKVFIGHESIVENVIFSPDGKLLATGSQDNTAKLWSVATGDELKTLVGHKGSIESLTFSPDGRYIATISEEETAKLWSVETGNCLKTFGGQQNTINSVVFSWDNQVLATVENGCTNLWSITTGEHLETCTRQNYLSDWVIFPPNSTYCLTQIGDNMRRDWLWEIHEPIQFYTAHKMSIHSKLASSDGKYVAGVSADNTVKLWRITTDCVQSPAHIYTYALGDLFKNGVALEPEDKTAAEQDIFCQKDADSQERRIYQRSKGAYQMSESYAVEESKRSLLGETIRLKEFANMDTVARLAMRIQSTSDTIEIYKLYNQLIDSLENRLKLAVDCKEDLIEVYKKQSWKALLVKNFETAERVSRKCLALDAKALRIKKNLGHALFFQGKYNDALKVYQDYAADTPEDKQKTNVQLILKDFDILEKIGITHADIEKIIKIL